MAPTDLEMSKELGIISEGLDYDGANTPDEQPTGLKSPTREAELLEANSVDVPSGSGSRGSDVDPANHCDLPDFSIEQLRADDSVQVPAKDSSGCVDDEGDNVQLVPLSDNDVGQLKHSDDGHLTHRQISDTGDSRRRSRHPDVDDTSDLAGKSDVNAGGSSLKKWSPDQLKLLTKCSVSLVRLSESCLPYDSPVTWDVSLDGDFTPGKNNLRGSEIRSDSSDCREGISETGSISCTKANNLFSCESVDSDFSALNSAGIAKSPADVILVEDSQVPCHAIDKEQNVAETAEMDCSACIGDTPEESFAKQACSPAEASQSRSPIGMLFTFDPVVPSDVEPRQQCSGVVTLQDTEVDIAQNSDDGKTECIVETQSCAEDLVFIGAGVTSDEAEEQFPMDSDKSSHKSSASDDSQTNEECNLSSTSLNLAVSDAESVVNMEGDNAVHGPSLGNDSEMELSEVLHKSYNNDSPKMPVLDLSSQKPGDSSRVESYTDDDDDMPLLAQAKTMTSLAKSTSRKNTEEDTSKSSVAKSTSRPNTEEDTSKPEAVTIEPDSGSRSHQTRNPEQTAKIDSQLLEMSSATQMQTIFHELETGLTNAVESQPPDFEGTSLIHSSDLPLFSQGQPSLSLVEAPPRDRTEPGVSVAGKSASPPSVDNVCTSSDDDLPLTLLFRRNSASAAELRMSDEQTAGRAYRQARLITKVRPRRRAAKKMLTLLRELSSSRSKGKRVDKSPENREPKGRKSVKLENRFVESRADCTDEVGKKDEENIIRSNDDKEDDDDDGDVEMSGDLTSEKEIVDDQSEKVVQDVENSGGQSCDLGSEGKQTCDLELMKSTTDVDGNVIISLENFKKAIEFVRDDFSFVTTTKLDSVLRDSANCFGTSASPPCLASKPALEPLQKQRCTEIPHTPPSASGGHTSSRGFLMASRAKQLFAAPSCRSKPGQMGVDSPRSSFFVASDYGKARNQEFGSPSVFRSTVPPRIFSPSASPSAGILRKKRLRGEETPVESPSPPPAKVTAFY